MADTETTEEVAQNIPEPEGTPVYAYGDDHEWHALLNVTDPQSADIAACGAALPGRTRYAEVPVGETLHDECKTAARKQERAVEREAAKVEAVSAEGTATVTKAEKADKES